VTLLSLFLLFFGQENSRMFAGWQVQELSEPGSDVFKDKSGNESITCGPIHVFENIKVWYL
jgi:hypothetical protein